MQAIKILIIEDNKGDVRLIKEALKDFKILVKTQVINNGEEALQFLQEKDLFQSEQRPDLIVLDLTLPKVSGKEILKYLKNHSQLKLIPVIILTSSQLKEDIQSSYDLNANCFITKPLELDEFVKAVHSIEEFWLTVVKLPRG